MDGPGGHHPEWGNPITKELSQHVLTDKWILAQKLRILKIQDTICKTHDTQEEQRQKCGHLLLLRIGNKTPMEGGTETTFGAETKWWTIQRLSQPGIHPIISFQMLTPLHTLARFCWKDPDIAVSCEAMLGPSKHRSGCSQSAIGWITGPPMEELEKVPKELKGSATL